MDSCDGSMALSLGSETSSACMLYDLSSLAALRHLKALDDARFAKRADRGRSEDGIAARQSSITQSRVCVSEESVSRMVLIVPQ